MVQFRKVRIIKICILYGQYWYRFTSHINFD